MPLLGFVLPLLLAVFGLGKILARHPGRERRPWMLAAAVSVPVLALAVTKYSDVASLVRGLGVGGWRLDPVPVVGLSYVAFKAVSFLVDTSSGKVVSPTLGSFLAYMLFFPTYLSGPIDRYDRFRLDLAEPPALDRRTAFEAGWRIVAGLFKKTVLVSVLAPFAISSFTADQIATAPRGTLWRSLYAFAFLVYWDFSGYTDIAIGTGRLFGIRVPENFRMPFLRRNIIEFWNAWHITLSHWLRDYLFFPFGKFLIKRWKGVRPVAVAAASYLFTFAIAGLWHGDGVNFLLWGLYMGIGLATCKVWGEITRAFPAGYHRFAFETIWGKALGVVLTFHFLLFGWIMFANDLGQALRVTGRLLGID
jgi:alginate O-acetyltransferase complex protein AlgI